ncbi:MAG TPA: hypothetical protein VGF12_00140 [Roseateles sp.]|uniref:hypothetical protein n=1 Tax=Roseateles sp. TaxID=1971397 RepID=UPI002ED7C569
MRVNTLSMKLNVRIEEAAVKEGAIVMSGFAGAMPCETVVAADEAAHMLRLCLKPAIIKLVLKAFFTRATPKASD